MPLNTARKLNGMYWAAIWGFWKVKSSRQIEVKRPEFKVPQASGGFAIFDLQYSPRLNAMHQCSLKPKSGYWESYRENPRRSSLILASGVRKGTLKTQRKYRNPPFFSFSELSQAQAPKQSYRQQLSEIPKETHRDQNFLSHPKRAGQTPITLFCLYLPATWPWAWAQSQKCATEQHNKAPTFQLDEQKGNVQVLPTLQKLKGVKGNKISNFRPRN